jgi:hypothetical protein
VEVSASWDFLALVSVPALPANASAEEAEARRALLIERALSGDCYVGSTLTGGVKSGRVLSPEELAARVAEGSEGRFRPGRIAEGEDAGELRVHSLFKTAARSLGLILDILR